MIYNKLVRDKIIDIIEKDSKKATFKILNQEEYIKALKDKLLEECKEVQDAKTDEEFTEELSDLLEVMSCLVSVTCGIPKVIEVGSNKRKERGSFNKRIFLKTVEDQ